MDLGASRLLAAMGAMEKAIEESAADGFIYEDEHVVVLRKCGRFFSAEKPFKYPVLFSRLGGDDEA